MGTDVAEVTGTLSYTYPFQVHRAMCTELLELVDRITRILPEIEAARPRCSSGIQALCLLNRAIERAKQLLLYCRESSKLYLAITGVVIVPRCQRSRDLLEQSLGQIQTMVPVILAAKISQIIDDLGAAVFVLDPSEEEAGKAVRELLHLGSASDSVEYSEIRALQLASSRLHITSPKAILIEKRSIKKLLDNVGDNDPTKKKVLKYLLYLLKKYGNVITSDQTENLNGQHAGFLAGINTSDDSICSHSVEVESHVGCEQYEAKSNISSRASPPEEFKCPISMRLMYDPVVLSSGQTFERMWVQKWLDEGNDTCPKTKVKLINRSLIPNTAMKDLISRWCMKYGITVPDPSMRTFHSLDASSTSIASFGSAMNDLHLPLDISNISLGSLDASYSADSSQAKIADGPMLKLMQKNDDHHKIHETDMEFLSRLAELPWESQCKVVEDVKRHLLYNDKVFHCLSSDNFVEPLIIFLIDAYNQHDIKALRAGAQLLLAFVSKNRSGMSYLHDDAFGLLASFLDSEVLEEALGIFEVLSSHPYCRSKITISGALVSVVKFLHSQKREFQEHAIKILNNLSSDSDLCSQMVSLECIPKLVPFINDSDLARYCIVLLRNLCDMEEGRVSIAETNGCIASVAGLLETGSCEDQEHSVSVLLSLCSQRVQYCHLVMEEGVIPSLVNISVNGSDKGKISALELLRQLRDVEYSHEQEKFGSDFDADRDTSYQSREKKSSSKTSGFFRMPFPKFSKHGSLLSKKKR